MLVEILFIAFYVFFASQQILYRLSYAWVTFNRRLDHDANLGIQIVQKLLADPVGRPPLTVFLCPSQGEFLALRPINKTTV